jgi:hypothetical protein
MNTDKDGFQDYGYSKFRQKLTSCTSLNPGYPDSDEKYANQR